MGLAVNIVVGSEWINRPIKVSKDLTHYIVFGPLAQLVRAHDS